jgi:hypothetical protein
MESIKNIGGQVMRCIKNLGRGWRIHGVPWNFLLSSICRRLFLRPQKSQNLLLLSRWRTVKLPMIIVSWGYTVTPPAEVSAAGWYRNFHGWLEGRLSCNMKHDETCVRFETANWLFIFFLKFDFYSFCFTPAPHLMLFANSYGSGWCLCGKWNAVGL